jgi:hypothetical protein
VPLGEKRTNRHPDRAATEQDDQQDPGLAEFRHLRFSPLRGPLSYRFDFASSGFYSNGGFAE